MKRNPYFVNDVEGKSAQLALLEKSLTEMVKPDLYSPFLIHAAARGRLVEREADAETIFSVEKGITPFDLERLRLSICHQRY